MIFQNSVPVHTLLKRFTLIYLLIVTVLTILLIITVRIEYQLKMKKIELVDHKRNEIAQMDIMQVFKQIDSDLRFAAELPLMKQYLDNGSPGLRDQLAEYLLLLSKTKRKYDKIRYLDSNGDEVIRINFDNGNPFIVPPEHLQQKSHRYLFKDAIALNQGDVYASPLDLNVEQNKIEIPYKPAIRFGMPVFDSDSHKKGILLINYLANDFLQIFHKEMESGDQIGMLLNSDGYWLDNADHKNEWGFMLQENNHSFARDFAEEWGVISSNEEGELLTSRGLYIYNTVYPMPLDVISSSGSRIISGSSAGYLTTSKYYWKIISFIPHELLSNMVFYKTTAYRVGLIFVYLLCGLVAFIYSYLSLNRKYDVEHLRIAAIAFESQDGLIITDSNSAILQVNSAFTHITGYAPEEIIGKNPRVLSSGRHDSNFYAAMWKSIKDTDAWQGEIWNRRKNGEAYPEYLSITAVKNKKGVVSNYVAAIKDITLDKDYQDKIKHMAFYDPLTNLPNRRLLSDRLQQAMASAARTRQIGALLYIDLDNFKTLNDTLGHVTGDRLLQDVSRRLISCVRESDTVARMGGDEFVLMLKDLSKDDAIAVTKTRDVGSKILATISQTYHLHSQDYHITASIGSTLFTGILQTKDELLKQADIAMYHAKNDGRNTMSFFDNVMQESVNDRAALEKELRNALYNQQLHLYYQIQVDHMHRPLGAEALIRWQHPKRGVVSPAQFIPLAEETGLILPIGLQVLKMACAQLKKWQQYDYTRELVLAINVSSRQFHQTGFVAEVRSIIDEYGIKPNLLKLELTESLLVTNIEEAIVAMQDLKNIGVQLSLDDFGTGYSSLQYLNKLPLNQLKIDQSFVRNLLLEASHKTIVTTIIAMAHSLKLEVIAEGVETDEQRQFLQNAGCMYYQGYLFSKPVPIEQFEALLKERNASFNKPIDTVNS